MAPARGRVATRKRKTKKTPRASSSLSSDCSREPSPVRYSEYEVQRKAKIARNAECLGSLEIAKIPARAQAAKRNQRPRCAHANLRSFAVPSIACVCALARRSPPEQSTRVMRARVTAQEHSGSDNIEDSTGGGRCVQTSSVLVRRLSTHLRKRLAEAHPDVDWLGQCDHVAPRSAWPGPPPYCDTSEHFRRSSVHFRCSSAHLRRTHAKPLRGTPGFGACHDRCTRAASFRNRFPMVARVALASVRRSTRTLDLRSL